MNPLVAALRHVLGITELGVTMTKASDQLNTLTTQVNDLINDVRANNEILSTKAGQLDEEGQAALDRLQVLVENFDAEIGDADKSEQTASPDPVATDDPSSTSPTAGL